MIGAGNVMRVFKPFKIIFQTKPLFFIYIVTGILVGQLGILFTFFEAKLTFCQILLLNLKNANLYVFSIALIAASIAPIFIEYISEENVQFKVYKIVTTIIMVFFLIVPMTYLSSLNFRSLINSYVIVTKIDWSQLIFYVVSIIFSIYMYCLLYLKYDTDSYAELEDKNILKLKTSTKKVKEDSKGNKL